MLTFRKCNNGDIDITDNYGVDMGLFVKTSKHWILITGDDATFQESDIEQLLIKIRELNREA